MIGTPRNATYSIWSEPPGLQNHAPERDGRLAEEGDAGDEVAPAHDERATDILQEIDETRVVHGRGRRRVTTRDFLEQDPMFLALIDEVHRPAGRDDRVA
jgi:hypothetical protein